MSLECLKARIIDVSGNVRFKLIQILSPSIWARSQNPIIDKVDHWNLFHAMVPRTSTLFARSFFKQRQINCAEIGVALAANAASILHLLNVNHLYLIDPYTTYLIPYKWKKKSISNHEQEKRLLFAQKKLKRWESKCTWLITRSEEAVSKIPDDYLDFIYIDGEHTYQTCYSDLTLYFPKMRQNSIIAGHDFTGDWLEIVRAVLDFCEEYDLELLTRQADWWMIKK